MPESDKEKEEVGTIEEKLDLLFSEVREIKSSLEDLSKKRAEFRVTWIFTIYTVGFGLVVAGIGFLVNWFFYISKDKTIFLQDSIFLISIGLALIVVSYIYARRYFRVDQKQSNN